mmetsp:Transcript_3575/g.7195  ORF Transcript_3575/g.7195 Transcript_3575/m.7195 type:complete len:322 (+) Transcript_3575:2558-3523(+)
MLWLDTHLFDLLLEVHERALSLPHVEGLGNRQRAVVDLENAVEERRDNLVVQADLVSVDLRDEVVGQAPVQQSREDEGDWKPHHTRHEGGSNRVFHAEDVLHLAEHEHSDGQLVNQQGEQDGDPLKRCDVVARSPDNGGEPHVVLAEAELDHLTEVLPRAHAEEILPHREVDGPPERLGLDDGVLYAHVLAQGHKRARDVEEDQDNQENHHRVTYGEHLGVFDTVFVDVVDADSKRRQVLAIAKDSGGSVGKPREMHTLGRPNPLCNVPVLAGQSVSCGVDTNQLLRQGKLEAKWRLARGRWLVFGVVAMPPHLESEDAGA